MKVLVTGGAGYIGSHTVVELIQAGHSVVIVDDLSNARTDVVCRVESIVGEKIKFRVMDCADKKQMRTIFQENEFDAVIHFAGRKAVGESVKKPLEYYRIVTTGEKRYKGHRQRKVQTEGFFSRNASAKPRTIQWD